MYYTALLALVVSFHWPIQKLDVENAFLNGYLPEEVYMVQPQGFMNPQHPQYVFQLNKVLYGLNQPLGLGFISSDLPYWMLDFNLQELILPYLFTTWLLTLLLFWLMPTIFW